MVGFFGMIVFARESYNVYGTMTLEFDDNVTYTYDSVDFYNGTILVKKDVDSFVLENNSIRLVYIADEKMKDIEPMLIVSSVLLIVGFVPIVILFYRITSGNLRKK